MTETIEVAEIDAIEMIATTDATVTDDAAATIAEIEMTATNDTTEETGPTAGPKTVANAVNAVNVPSFHRLLPRNSAPSMASSRSPAKDLDSCAMRAATSCSILRTCMFHQILFGSIA